MSKLSGYIYSSWEEVDQKEKNCVKMFEDRICKPLVENSKIRTIMKFILPEGVRPSAQNVRVHLFSVVRVKRNWKRIGTFADRRLLGLLYGTCDTKTIAPAYYWSYTHPYWKSSFESQ